VKTGTILALAIAGILIGLESEFYTSGSPVRTVANASTTGPATTIITATNQRALSIPASQGDYLHTTHTGVPATTMRPVAASVPAAWSTSNSTMVSPP